MNEKKLTLKQQRFCEEYIKSGNATEAARQAGYKLPTAQGFENLRKPNISSYIAERMRPQQESLIASADEVLRFYSAVMRGELEDRGQPTGMNDRIKAADALQKRYMAIEERLSASAGDEQEGGVVELPQVADE